MFLFLASFTNSLTWKQLIDGQQFTYEQVKKSVEPNLQPHQSNQPILYKNENIKHKINNDVQFVGIVNCQFEDIENIYDGLIQLRGSSLTVQNTTFKNIQNGHAINIDYCYSVKITDCTFHDFKNSSGIIATNCNDFHIQGTLFKYMISSENIEHCSLLIDTCTNIILDSTIFTENEFNSSIVVISNSNIITVNNATFSLNNFISPGSLFVSSSDNVVVQNSVFRENYCNSHSAGLLSVYSTISLLHCLFEGNGLLNVVEIPKIVGKLPLWSAAVTVTIVQSLVVVPTQTCTVLKDVSFHNNMQLPTWIPTDFSIISIDVEINGQKTLIDGTVDTTGTKRQFTIQNADENVKTGIADRAKLAYFTSQPEIFNATVNYAVQPLLPSLEQKKIQLYYMEPVVDMEGPYAFIKIDRCTFEDSNIITAGNKDKTSYIHIDLNGAGKVSITNSVFEDNAVSSSLIEVVNADGVAISECTFSYNMAKHSSGALVANCREVKVCGNTFEKNCAYIHGALAIYNCSNALIIQNTFRKNTGFFGCSSVVVSDATVYVNDTTFVKNNVDFEESDIPSGYDKIAQSDLIERHETIPSVTTPREFAVSLSVYGKSQLFLSNVAFSDSENEAETMNSTYFTLVSLDGYSESSVTVRSEKTCSDARNSGFNSDWGVTLIDDVCSVNEFYRHIEVYEPKYVENTGYAIVSNATGTFLTPETYFGVVYDPLKRAECTVTVDSVVPDKPDYPEPQKPEPQIQKSTKQVLIISSSFIGVTLIIIIAAAIKYCRQPPDEYIEEDDERRTNLIDDEDIADDNNIVL